MAYKFQLGDFAASGSILVEGKGTAVDDIIGRGDIYATGSFIGAGLSLGGTAVTATAAELNQMDGGATVGTTAFATGDGLVHNDNGVMKQTSVDTLATFLAGSNAGLAATSGQLAIDIDNLAELDAAPHATQDEFIVSDNGTEKRVSMTHVAEGAFALVTGGDITIAANGVATIAEDAVEAAMLNDNCISGQSNLGGVGVDDADEFLFSDGGTLKALTGANLYGWVFGKVSGDATVAAGGALTIANDAIESGMINDNIISGQTELAQASLAAADELLISDGGTVKRYGVDSLAKDMLALTTEAAIANGDYLMFLDGSGTGETKKEALADVATLFAGDGLTAGSSILAVNCDDSTIETNSDSLRVKAGGIANSHINASAAIADSKLAAISTANKVALTALDIDGGSDIGAALVDADLMIVDDGAGGTNKKATMVRLKSYMSDMTGFNLTADQATFTGRVKFEGDVHVSGALTTVDSVNTTFYDGIIGLGYQSGSNDLVKGDRGFVFGLDAENDTAMIWDESASQFAFITTTQGPGDVAIDGNMTVTSYADLRCGMITATGISAGVNVVSKDDSEVSNGGAGFALTPGDVLVLEQDLGGNRKVILPNPVTVGDSVEIKLKGIGAAGRALYVETDGATSHTIDGGQSIILESPYAAVKLIYVAANDWRVF